MKRLVASLSLAAAAAVAGGHAALACDTVTAMILDASANDEEYAYGGVLMIVDRGNFAQPIAGTSVQAMGGQFSVKVPANIGAAKAIVSLYRPAGENTLPPLSYDIAMNGTPGTCLAIEETVDSVIHTSMTEGAAIAF